ncbi:MAG TPA: hypothetical protein VHN78_15355 [Chloroflexota bacterium]|nr:hypothetical protein [Chloroflexota bacterium]
MTVPHDQPLQLIREGPTELLVPQGERALGPGRTREGVFFNPAMALGRDLSVLYLAAVVQPGMKVLDALTGLGARAVRWRWEVPGDYQVTANDWSPPAVALARANISRRPASGGRALDTGCAPADGAGPAATVSPAIRLLERPLGALLAEERFAFIDLDAPGSPVPFLDAACQSMAEGGHLLVTATDTMILAGTQPRVCRRRYGAWPMPGELGHEVAVRVLVGAVVRTAARYTLAASPTLCYAHGHWYGAYVRLTKDEAGADAALDALGYAVRCGRCWDRRVIRGERGGSDGGAEDGGDDGGDDGSAEGGGGWTTRCRRCGASARLAGPLWTGSLWDTGLLRRMVADERPLATQQEVRGALQGWLEEADAPPLYYDLHAAAGHLARLGRGGKLPRLDTVQERLVKGGFRSVRTHFARVGLKTDAPAPVFLDLVGE